MLKTKTVVGARIATCLLSATALKAALMAISVLPKPISPQINLSIGLMLPCQPSHHWLLSVGQVCLHR